MTPQDRSLDIVDYNNDAHVGDDDKHKISYVINYHSYLMARLTDITL